VSNDEIADQLFTPVRIPKTIDELHRNVRAIEDYVNAPHRTYGSRMISPLFYEEVTGADAFTIKAANSGSFGGGVWDGVVVDLERRFRAFVWGEVEFLNSDAADDYHAALSLPVSYSGNTDAGFSMRQWAPHAGTHRVLLTNLRMVDVGLDAKTTVTFQWAVQQDSGANQDATVNKRKMIVAIFDAPDTVQGVPVNWTRFDQTRTAYRTKETNETI
jgi:hypothetical protein